MEVRNIDPKLSRELRHRVLWPHKTFETSVIDFDYRSDAFHLGTFDGEKLVAIGSFFETASPKINFEKQYRLRAMATDPDFRGRRTGQMLVQRGIEILKDKACDVLWCDARVVAVGFYEKIGFQLIDEIYDVPIIGPHKFMYFQL
ncbi:MAG: GNAT family N-acetyltransferase [Flavobacteriales bacterium]|nr:GNAT family N-acetyltransferase [Flavobacteriales bacterium]